MPISPEVQAVSTLLNASRSLSLADWEASKILTDAAYSILRETERCPDGEVWLQVIFLWNLHSAKLRFWS